MKGRTVQDLLTERRANVQELRGERDATARKLLEHHIAAIDREIGRRAKLAGAVVAALGPESGTVSQ